MTDPSQGNPQDRPGKQVGDLEMNPETVQELTESEGEDAKGGLFVRSDTDSGCTTTGTSCCSEISTDCCYTKLRLVR
jgi:hypothetical protein